jgi:ABC-type glycerol-3-phosphate transport system substrate-binding protein
MEVKSIRFMCLILICMLVTGIMTGCVVTQESNQESKPGSSKNTETTTPPTAEQFKGQFEVFVNTDENFPEKPDWEIFDYIEDKTGIRINYTAASGEVYETKLNLMIASGTLPDIVYTNTTIISSIINLADVFDAANKPFFILYSIFVFYF